MLGRFTLNRDSWILMSHGKLGENIFRWYLPTSGRRPSKLFNLHFKSSESCSRYFTNVKFHSGNSKTISYANSLSSVEPLCTQTLRIARFFQNSIVSSIAKFYWSEQRDHQLQSIEEMTHITARCLMQLSCKFLLFSLHLKIKVKIFCRGWQE